MPKVAIPTPPSELKEKIRPVEATSGNEKTLAKELTDTTSLKRAKIKDNPTLNKASGATKKKAAKATVNGSENLDAIGKSRKSRRIC